MDERNDILKIDLDENEEMIATEVTAEETIVPEAEHYHSHHHHHRHRHSSHHSHRRHKSRGSKKKMSKRQRKCIILTFIKKHKSVIVNIVSCSVALSLLVMMAVNIDIFHNKGVDEANVELTQSTIRLETSFFAKDVSLVSEAVAYYIGQNDGTTATEVYKAYDGFKGGLNEGLPLNFAYDVTGLPVNAVVKEITLEISENSDMSGATAYPLNMESPFIEIYNLKTGTKYFYKVTLIVNEDCEFSTNGTFKTADTPRILKIDGAVNVRDIGGYKTVNGKTVRQGLLFRGSELDGAVEKDYKITDAGLKELVGKLGVKFDMDLRGAHENKTGIDALGSDIPHKYYGIGMYSDIFNPDNAPRVRNVFADLSNPSNYPIYLHCTYGRDRTGTISYLLEALLGMSSDQLNREYNLSAFTDSYVATDKFNDFVSKVNAFNGSTLSEKVENYLLSIGVTGGEINSIKNIFLG